MTVPGEAPPWYWAWPHLGLGLNAYTKWPLEFYWPAGVDHYTVSDMVTDVYGNVTTTLLLSASPVEFLPEKDIQHIPAQPRGQHVLRLIAYDSNDVVLGTNDIRVKSSI